MMIVECLVVLLMLIIGFKCYAARLYNHGKCSTMLILGSGGHTAELLSYVRSLPPFYTPRIYIVASTDTLSGKKAVELEQWRQKDDFVVEKLPRAREVGQSFISSFFSTLYAICLAALLVIKHQPQLVLCNGPGTCVPVCLVARLLHVICGMLPIEPSGRKTAVVFVESVCRTRTLSLSGRLLYHFRLADIIVQWPGLLDKYPRAHYLGLLS
ncbi:hypothetical protein Aperf_G00000036841 [Anoplocephala perfoliata]